MLSELRLSGEASFSHLDGKLRAQLMTLRPYQSLTQTTVQTDRTLALWIKLKGNRNNKQQHSYHFLLCIESEQTAKFYCDDKRRRRPVTQSHATASVESDDGRW